MSKLIEFFFCTLPLILSCIYLLIAVYAVDIHIRKIKRKNETSIGQWLFAILNFAYAMYFFVTAIFFTGIWETVFSFLGLMAAFVSFVWSQYEDKVKGQRWWEW